MLSKGLLHYPRIIFRDREKYLWNPVLKRAFKNLPEERVRLKLVEYLIEEAGFSKNRMSFESPVNLPRDKASSRTDLICYNQDFKPLLLAECKAQEIKLDEKAAIQIARYNTEVGAPFLLITNGKVSYWFESQNKQLNTLTELPEYFIPKKFPEYTFNYWSQRGFAGENASSDTRSWITKSCTYLYSSTDEPILFYNFDGADPKLYLPNYYRVIETGTKEVLAIALSATQTGSTLFNAVFNQNGENVAILSTTIDQIPDDNSDNTIIHSEKGLQQVNIKDAGFSLGQSVEDLITSALNLLNKY